MYQLPQISRLKSIVKCFSLTRISIDPQTYPRINEFDLLFLSVNLGSNLEKKAEAGKIHPDTRSSEGWEGRPKIDSRECGSVFYDGSRSTRHNSDLGSLNCFISNSSTTSNDTRRIKAADRPVGVAFSLESSSSLRFALLYYRCCSLTPTLWPHRRGNYTGRGRCNWVTASPTIRDTLRLSLCVWRGDYLNNNLVSRWKKKCVTTSSVVEEGGPSTTLMIIHSDDCSR